jgi:hypothetical protein
MSDDKKATGAGPKDALTTARELIQADKQARIEAFGKAVAELQERHKCEFVVMPPTPITAPDGTVVIPPATIGIRAMD